MHTSAYRYHAFFVLISLVFSASCKKSVDTKLVTKEYSLSSVDSISLVGEGNLTIEQGNKEQLVVEAEENLLPFIQTKVNEKKLTISVDTLKMPRPHKPVQFHAYVKKLNRVDAKGSSSIRVRGVNTERLHISAQGSVELELSGTVKDQTLDLQGMITYDAGAASSKCCHIESMGTNKIIVNCTDGINGSLNGLTMLTYIGKPKLDVKKAGLSSIVQKDKLDAH